MSETTICRYSIDELKTLPSETDWDRVNAISQEEAERLADEEDDELGITEWDWEQIKLVTPKPKRPITIRIDDDVLEVFKAMGPGYQTRINTVLRHYANEVMSRKQS